MSRRTWRLALERIGGRLAALEAKIPDEAQEARIQALMDALQEYELAAYVAILDKQEAGKPLDATERAALEAITRKCAGEPLRPSQEEALARLAASYAPPAYLPMAHP